MASGAVKRSVGIIRPQSTALFLCDMQEKFAPNIKFFPQIVSNSSRVFKAAQAMKIPVWATEQYPKGLGPTVPELGLAESGVTAIAKTCFSMAAVPEIKAGVVENPDIKSVVMCGIETHACIHHTTLELMEAGKDVHIVVDCCSSRSHTDRKYALDRLRDVGAFLTTSEGIILSFAPDAAHPNFKQIQKLVMHSAENTGLLNLAHHDSQ